MYTLEINTVTSRRIALSATTLEGAKRQATKILFERFYGHRGVLICEGKRVAARWATTGRGTSWQSV